MVRKDHHPPEAGAFVDPDRPLVERRHRQPEAGGGEVASPKLQARKEKFEPEASACEIWPQPQADVQIAIVGVVEARQLPSGTEAEEPHQRSEERRVGKECRSRWS